MVCLLLRIRVCLPLSFSLFCFTSVCLSSILHVESNVPRPISFMDTQLSLSSLHPKLIESVDFTRVIRPQIQVDGLLLQLLYSREYQYIIPSIINPQNTNNS